MSDAQPGIVEKVRRSVHRTQWAAQFAVASELCKRGYEVAFTMGNHPSIDIMVTSPRGCPFGVDVKGLYKKNFWAVRAKAIRTDLFYVLAFVPDDSSNRFFVLTQSQVNTEIAADIERARSRAIARGAPGETAERFPGIGWRFAETYEGQWSALPS